MKTRNKRPLKNQNAERESDERDRSAGRDWQTDVARAEHWPQHNCDRDDRQRDEDRHRPGGDAALRILSHEQTKKRAA